MADRIPIGNTTEAALKAADIICVLDRDVPGFHIQLWGQESTAPIVPYGGPPHRSNCIDLEIDSKDDTDLQKALRMVEGVPKDVQHLKK